MAENINDLKKQRDRFLAFAFASADLLLEVDENQKITFSSGAARKFTGNVSTSLIGHDWLEILTQEDRAMVVNLHNQAMIGKRCGPILVNLNEQNDIKLPSAIVTGMKLPDYPNSFFITISQGSALSAKAAQDERNYNKGMMLDKENFTAAAIETISNATLMGQDLDMTFLDIPGTSNLKNKLEGEDWDHFKSQLSGLLKSSSIDGQTASELSSGRYGLLHEKGIGLDGLKNQIQSLSKETDPDGVGLEIETKTVSADPNGLSEREFAKALVYTISKFEEKGNDLTIGSINEGFEGFLKENADRITSLKSVINQQRFNLAFQPIVDFKTGETHHYEALVRFEGNKSPYEIITFGEDIGLAPEVDIMICSKALNYLIYNMEHDKNMALAVNISGVSIQNEAFIKALRSKFEPHLKTLNIADRIMFEITESSQINDLDQVNYFVQELQQDGFKVWLDDFGAGSASFQYLQKLHVDGVKIDGQYVDQIIDSDRDGKLVKNLVSLCKDLDMKTIAERVETKEQAKFLQSINVDYGQGYLFAKPSERPDYHLKKKK